MNRFVGRWGSALAAALLLASCSSPAAPTATQAPSATQPVAPAPAASSASNPASPAPASGSPAASPAASAIPSAVAAAAPGGTADKLTVAYSAVSASQLPMLLAKEEGFFAQNDLDVDVISIAGGSSPTAALLSGQIQFLQISVEAMQAALEGADLVYIAAPSNAVTFSMFSIPSITTGAELKGKRIGVTGVGTATYTAAELALRSFGLDPTTDVTFTSINNVPAILGGLQSGAIEAGTLSMPTVLQARNAGMRELVNVADLGIPFPNAWETASRSYLDAHPDIARRFVRSIVQAIAFEEKNPEATEQVLSGFSQVSDPTILQQSYASVAPYLNNDPTPSIDAVQNALDDLGNTLPKAKTADPASFVDTSYVTELKQSGFLDAQFR